MYMNDFKEVYFMKNFMNMDTAKKLESYEKPSAEKLSFAQTDIVTTSGSYTNDETNYNWD